MMERKLSICVMSTLVNDKYKEQILGCKETWCIDAEKYNIPVEFFCGSIEDEKFSFVTHLKNVSDDYISSTFKQYYGLKHLLKNKPSEFYLIIGTDTYVNIEDTLNMLEKYNYINPFIIGGFAQNRFIYKYSVIFSLGGGGIILSHSALKIMEPFFDELLNSWFIETNKPKYEYLKGACDVSLFYLAWEKGITHIIERDMYSCSWNGKFYNSNVSSGNFCSDIRVDKIITCHFMERKDMNEYRKYKNSKMSNIIVLYGIEGKYIDVTSKVMNKMYSEGKIYIPSSDIQRSVFFGDPLIGVVKNIKIINDNISKTYYDEEINIKIDHKNKIYKNPSIKNWIKIYENIIPDEFSDNCIKLFNNSKLENFNESYRKCQIFSNFDKHYLFDELKLIVKKALNEYRSEMNTGTLNFVNTIEAPNIIYYNCKDIDCFNSHSDNWSIETSTRQLSVIFYLNDVNEGGCTTFTEYNISVKPKKNSILIFPSFYLFTHTGENPISNSKYIIVSWLHFDGNNHSYRVHKL